MEKSLIPQLDISKKKIFFNLLIETIFLLNYNDVMKKIFLLIVTSLFVFSGFARDKSSLKFRLVYDGPYIDLENQSVPEGFEAIRILKE